eukprot:10067-Hanusia_phi.AAC.1
MVPFLLPVLPYLSTSPPLTRYPSPALVHSSPSSSQPLSSLSQSSLLPSLPSLIACRLDARWHVILSTLASSLGLDVFAVRAWQDSMLGEGGSDAGRADGSCSFCYLHLIHLARHGHHPAGGGTAPSPFPSRPSSSSSSCGFVQGMDGCQESNRGRFTCHVGWKVFSGQVQPVVGDDPSS